jgi:penicillin-binding protein 2
MQAVIYGGAGATGQGLGEGFPYRIAGKSGTAERYSRRTDAYDTNKNSAYLAARHRAWFIAYTPADDPQVAVAVVLEAGAWGGKDAGPIARKILDAWLATQGNQAPKATPLPAPVTLPAPGDVTEAPQAEDETPAASSSVADPSSGGGAP